MRTRGRGSKNPKFLRTSYLEAPNGRRVADHGRSNVAFWILRGAMKLVCLNAPQSLLHSLIWGTILANALIHLMKTFRAYTLPLHT